MLVQPLLIGLWLVAAPAEVSRPADNELLRQAEADFRRGLLTYGTSQAARECFARAAARYDELRRRGANNPALYANLGQAYLLAGDLPRAILAYRHGLRLSPNDQNLHQCLEEARNQVVYTVAGAFGKPPVDNWPPWLPRLGTRIRLVLVLVLYGLACAALTRWGMTRQGAYLGLAGPALAVAAFLGGGLFVEARERAWEKEHPVVVISAKAVVLHKGNGANYPCYDADNRTWLEAGGTIPAGASPLPWGAEARLRYESGDWIQIELAGGEVGWVRRGDVVIDSAG
jgi:tetratricopeptide (TPR) repeat protein